ncbi:MAG: sensor histidine kinase [Mongoliitalea sp.]
MEKIAEELKLYRILDTEREEFFDRITKNSAAFSGCEISLVVFLDNQRQWFKATTGLDMRETEIKYSLCKELVGSALDLLVIPDLADNPNFQNHPALLDFGIRFYAGAGIYSEKGILLGTVCLMDTQPKHLEDFHFDFLKNQAVQVQQMLEIRRKKAEVEKEKQALEVWRFFTEKAALLGGVGGFIINVEKNKLHWWPTNNVLFGLPSNTLLSFDDFMGEKDLFSDFPDIKDFFSEIKQLAYASQKSEGDFLFHVHQLGNVLKVNYRHENELFYVFIEDNTKNYTFQKEITQQHNLIKKLEMVSDVGAWEYTLNQRKLVFTPNLYRLFAMPLGVDPSVVILESCFDEKSWTQLLIDGRNCLKENRPFTNVYRLTFPDQSVKWIKVYGEKLSGESEDVQITGSAQDVTEDMLLLQALKEKVKQIEEKNKYLDRLVNNQSFFIFKTDLQGRIKFYNSFYEEKFVKDKTSMIGSQSMDLILEEDRKDCLDTVKKAIANPGQSFKVKFRSRNRQGELLVGVWDFSFQLTEATGEGEILCLGCDITELEEKSSSLKKLSHFMGFLNNKLIEFSNITSHNIRSQVSNLKGLLVLMEIAEDAHEKASYIQLMNGTVDNLDQLLHKIMEILTINSAENNQKEKIELRRFIQEVLVQNFPTLDSDQVALSIECDASLEVILNRAYLQSVLVKLLTNAIDFKSPNRKLALAIEVQQNVPNDRFLTIQIMDNGLGMEIDPDPTKLFRLYQTNHQISGSKGFGLFFVKNIIEFMGGSIFIQSKVDYGTKIKIELPYES